MYACFDGNYASNHAFSITFDNFLMCLINIFSKLFVAPEKGNFNNVGRTSLQIMWKKIQCLPNANV